MRLLLLGCTGFVGKELVPTLLNENHEIYIVSRKPISKLKLDLDFNKFKFFQIDLSKEKNWNNENLLNILKETDGIINLMGEPIAEKKWTSEQKQEIENSRINTTKFMMKTLKDLKINPKVIINGSAIGITVQVCLVNSLKIVLEEKTFYLIFAKNGNRSPLKNHFSQG